MAESSGFPESLTRRGVVAAAGGVGLAAVLTACGSDSDSGSDAGASPGASDPTAADTSAPAESGGPATAGDGMVELGKVDDIPVGGGKIFADQKVVVTQPTAGEYKAFSAVCTHRGCTVSSVSAGVILCPCHNTKFKAADGSVMSGPATSPLPEKKIMVAGDEAMLA